jgi:NAD(P)-dependent dehydrogenase (short-subunit alcohol dehydrogenase family)
LPVRAHTAYTAAMAPLAEAIPASIPRAALVTGGAKRLGRAICLGLAEAGFDVAIHYGGSAAEAEDTAETIRSLGRRAAALRADLAREAEVSALLPAAAAALGRPLGVLVNNASAFERDEWADATRESWDRHMEPNLRAPFVLTQAFARALPAGAEGVVVNMLDQRVWSPTPHFLSYTLSKAGLWSLTQQLALALAPRIRVNGIGPGPALPSPRQSAEQFARQCASVPLGRGTSPEEVARAVLCILALPAMTGQMLALDGGQHLQWSPGSSAAALPE